MKTIHTKTLGGRPFQIGVFDAEGNEWWVCPDLWAIVEDQQSWLEELKAKGMVSPVTEFKEHA